MTNYFHRQIELWGIETQNSLKDKKIAIIGCGGLGSSLAFALGSSGIGYIHVVDFDTVTTHNIHRQIALSLGDEELPKAKIIKQSIEKRSEFVHVEAHECRFEQWSEANQERFDLIIDATDNLPIRAKINDYAKKTKTPWLYGSVEDWNGQVCLFEKSDFNATIKAIEKKPAGIAAPIVMHIASLQANIALRYLAGLHVSKDILHYVYFDKNGEYQVNKFKMPKSGTNNNK